MFTGGRDEGIPSHHLGEVVDRQSHTLWTGIGRDIDELAMTIDVRIAPNIADDLAGSINIQCAAPNPSAIIKIDDFRAVIPPRAIRRDGCRHRTDDLPGIVHSFNRDPRSDYPNIFNRKSFS